MNIITSVNHHSADRLLRVLDTERVAIVFVLFNLIMRARAWAATAVSDAALDAVEAQDHFRTADIVEVVPVGQSPQLRIGEVECTEIQVIFRRDPDALPIVALERQPAYIVAVPTAGACGVLPAVLLPLCKYEELTQHQLLEALYVAAGIGSVIAYKASIAGASGGCQAEIGTASAMAAGALVALRGGEGEQIGHAVAMALKNLMGLVCDPVAGLVEVPCVKRNVIGAVNAVSAADMALAGIESRIPVDEVIDAMGEVGRRMPVEFRETALGGLAATPTGERLKRELTAKREKQ